MSAPTVDRSGVNYHDKSYARIRKIGRMVGPTSYTTGGDFLGAPALGLGKADAVLFEPFTNGTDIKFGLYVIATGKLKFFDMAGAEIGNLTDLSTYSARFEAIGY
jgi:hypothetical protein